MKKKNAPKEPKIVRLDRTTTKSVGIPKAKKPATRNYGSSFDPKEIGIDRENYSYDCVSREWESYDGGNPHDG